MSYTKTNWVNNITPIDKDNLNKIEQGIYNNSLVVDAVTNTLNPTDTETYKTAELTEGQITDVIGVSDIVIKGQTSQDGEPTPSSPVDVNVVSGSNVINTSNKNLFIPSLKNDGTSIFVNNATVSLIKDEYTFIASGSDMFFGQVANTGATYSKTNGIKIYKNGNTKLSFLVTNTTFNRVYITAYNSQGVSLGFTAFNGISGTYTFPENCEFVTIRIGKNNAVSGTTYKTKVMVVYGDTIPTTYEPHQGKELPLDLGSIELCKIGNYQDYFYKSGSKWYLHKEVGKKVYTGNGTISNPSTNRYNINNINLEMFKSSNSDYFCDKYITTPVYSTNAEFDNYVSNYNFALGLHPNGIGLRIKDTRGLSNANLIEDIIGLSIYGALKTSTNTEITDTTLISQLEAIYNAPLYEQTNITQTNNDLPMVLNITACKDNINGIKAFIRK